MNTINSSNIEIPVFSAPGIIHRMALIKKMTDTSAKKNIFITAPGGYGKTVAATQWLASMKGVCARLTVGDADNDPCNFYLRLTRTLWKLMKKSHYSADTMISRDDFLETLSMLPKKSGRCYLLIDDLHLIKNEELLDDLPMAVSRLPDYIRLCLISRAAPSATLLGTGRFGTLTQDDLMFSLDEIEWLCEEKDRSHTPEQIMDLYKTTGGWAMYISAILSGNNDSDADEKAPRTLLQYLESRVWILLDRETKLLLLRLAVPYQLEPELCARLTGNAEGRGVLERLMKRENAFLSKVGEDTYRFHDIFREFLLERMDRYISAEEVKRLNDITAEWRYEQERYYESARHYIRNGDHEGINRCMKSVSRFHDRSGNPSVEFRLNFTKQYVSGLSTNFIEENPYLVTKCAVMAHHDGNADAFTHYADMMYKKRTEIASHHPELLETIVFTGGLDFRLPLRDYTKQVLKLMSQIRNASAPRTDAKASTITQNLPYYHRSMRDYSEYYALNVEDMELLRQTFGLMIGGDYNVMEEAIIAGILYERGELTEACRHALNGYHICEENMHSETVFTSYMILAAIFFAIGASREAGRVMAKTEAFIEQKALFLRPNFRAIKTERAIRAGDVSAAKEWLDIYGKSVRHLSFFQICRHFATLRSHIAVKDYKAAVSLGKRLQKLACEYQRPLDQIESGLLTAIALWHDSNKTEAIKQLEQAISVAAPYGFTQLFINEGKEILPLLWALREKTGVSDSLTRFTDKLTNVIYAEHNFGSDMEHHPRLTEKQKTMLLYLNQGMSYNEIAAVMKVAHGTVKTHVLGMYKRLEVHNVREAIVKARMLGFLE